MNSAERIYQIIIGTSVTVDDINRFIILSHNVLY